jgi:hypothetical protein
MSLVFASLVSSSVRLCSVKRPRGVGSLPLTGRARLLWEPGHTFNDSNINTTTPPPVVAFGAGVPATRRTRAVCEDGARSAECVRRGVGAFPSLALGRRLPEGAAAPCNGIRGRDGCDNTDGSQTDCVSDVVSPSRALGTRELLERNHREARVNRALRWRRVRVGIESSGSVSQSRELIDVRRLRARSRCTPSGRPPLPHHPLPPAGKIRIVTNNTPSKCHMKNCKSSFEELSRRNCGGQPPTNQKAALSTTARRSLLLLATVPIQF